MTEPTYTFTVTVGFCTAQDAEQLRQAVERFIGIVTPEVNDPDCTITEHDGLGLIPAVLRSLSPITTA